MSARKTCRKCGGRFAIPMEEVEACADEGKCSLRAALRTERRKVRVLKKYLNAIADGECEFPTIDDGRLIECNDTESESPCAPCAARRGLERAKERRGK